MAWILDHITKENGKYYAEVKEPNMKKREHTGNICGWNGMSYSSLRLVLEKHYNIALPAIKEMKILKKTECRTIYIL